MPGHRQTKRHTDSQTSKDARKARSEVKTHRLQEETRKQKRIKHANQKAEQT